MILKGTVLTCSKCNKELLKAVRDVEDGTNVPTYYFKSLHTGQDLGVGIKLMSHCCGKAWFRFEDGQVQYHTKQGWE